jgi:hypothetical protein
MNRKLRNLPFVYAVILLVGLAIGGCTTAQLEDAKAAREKAISSSGAAIEVAEKGVTSPESTAAIGAAAGPYAVPAIAAISIVGWFLERRKRKATPEAAKGG